MFVKIIFQIENINEYPRNPLSTLILLNNTPIFPYFI